MKTLEELRKENPGYDVWQGGKRCVYDSSIEVRYGGSWQQLKQTESQLGLVYEDGSDDPYVIPICYLTKLNCLFRRKKERKREFVIEQFGPSGHLTVVDEDGQHYSLEIAGRRHKIKRATLRVDEWEDES